MTEKSDETMNGFSAEPADAFGDLPEDDYEPEAPEQNTESAEEPAAESDPDSIYDSISSSVESQMGDVDDFSPAQQAEAPDDLPDSELPAEDEEYAGGEDGQVSDGEDDGSEQDEQESEEDDGEEGGTSKVLRVLTYCAAVLLMAFVISFAVWNLAQDVFGFGKPDQEAAFTVSDGDSVSDVTENLYEQGFIKYKWLFGIFCGITNADQKISTGTYTLNYMYDYHALLNGLRASSGNRNYVTLSFREGATCSQIFDTLAENGVCTVDELEDAAANYQFDYSFLENVPYGDANRLEGFLYPDSYDFYLDDSPVRVLSKFLDTFEKKVTLEMMDDIADVNDMLRVKMTLAGYNQDEIQAAQLDLRGVLTVASIVQKESGSITESAALASVIYNRLCSKAYPLLQMESPLRYALNKWDEDLTDEDYLLVSDYNTYRYQGLPDTPIGNPGIDSIRAAIYPKDTEYLFAAKNPSSGMHHFAETYYENETYLEGLKKK